TWIHQQLEADGYHTIFPGRDFKAGSNFVVEMRNALNVSARMIAVVSPAYLASPYTQAEWTDVFRRDPTGEKGLLIPVLVASCEAGPLLGSVLRINLIDMIDKDQQKAQKRLLQGVRRSPDNLSWQKPTIAIITASLIEYRAMEVLLENAEECIVPSE